MNVGVKTKKNIVMIGLEEGMELADYGERSRMIAKAMSDNEQVNQVIQIAMPRFFVSALKDKRALDCKKIINKVDFKEYQQSDKRFFVTLRTFIPEKISFLYKWYVKLIAKRIQKYIESKFGDDFILWIAYPRAVDIAKYLTSKEIVFDTIDNWLEYSEVSDKKRFEDYYKWVDDNVDVIVIATEAQKVLYNNINKIFIMPNAVDDIFFEKYDEPEDIKNIKKPIVGYVGTLQERFDTELMEQVVNALPDVSFVFVGPDRTDGYFDGLKDMGNTYFLGSKKYKQIPACIQSFDVAIIPHVVNDFTESMSPLKAYEYLACYKNVIMTPIAGSEEVNEQVNICSKADDFVEKIKELLEQNFSKELEVFVKKNSWNARVENFIRSIL